MIGSLRGTVVHRRGAELLLEVGGLGYRVTVNAHTAVALAEQHGEVFVWVHHHLREDAQVLYGFAAADERDVFESLIGAHGVGPALALAILGVHQPGELRRVLATDDVAALCLVPGVGRKTAARLLVELKPKLATGDADIAALSGPSDGTRGVPTPRSDVRDALAGLGYSAEEVNEVLRRLSDAGDATDLLKEALQMLAAA